MADRSLAWETVECTTSYSCPGFDIKTERVRLPDGTETAFDFLHEPPAVVVIPFDETGTVIAIKEWRHAVKRVITSFPAGTVEPDDVDLPAAAGRELAEETGYRPGDLEYLTAAEPANGIANSVHHYFVARDCTQTAERDLDENESIRVFETDLASLRRDIADSNCIDGRTALGLLYYDRFSAETNRT